MSDGLNQDWVLARWREDAARDDPPFYTLTTLFGLPCAWLSLNGNTGWYTLEFDGPALTGVRSIASPPPSPAESPDERRARNHAFKLLSPKRRRKIEALFSQRTAT